MLIATSDKIDPPESSSSTSSPTTSEAPPTSTSSSLIVSNTGMSGDHRPVIRYPSEYIKLNIGGSLHYTTLSTLRKHDTMLRAMFSGRMDVHTDSEGWILIDRCGKHFGTILNFLRDGFVALPESPKEITELLAEAKYYCITELAESCEQALLRKEREAEPICRVALITSQKEEQFLISSTTKPVIKLLINRHNNKYSYTSTSDDNLLKNIELFDKMSLRFNGRVLFIKDVIGSIEICCWTFYGHGRKVGEVCCHSIVYTTDKKHTKVEFPEARIYEETLNILLYEHRNGPDQELMQATSSRGAVGGGPPCTSDEEEDIPSTQSLWTILRGLKGYHMVQVCPGPSVYLDRVFSDISLLHKAQESTYFNTLDARVGY